MVSHITPKTLSLLRIYIYIYTEHFHQSCIVKEIVAFNNKNENKKWDQKIQNVKENKG